MLDLNHIFSSQRTHKQEESLDSRSEYQRDFDRIIFSSAFRRLQNKTQVFPLPGSVFVHNRLTHSLEVSSVGRSLGHLAGEFFVDNYDLNEVAFDFYKYRLESVISSACLCHDIGNPAFGHSGEDAIANYFENRPELKSLFTDEEWTDFIHFEGNANAIRILTQQQNGKAEGGIRLTSSTLSAIAKYPCESIARDKSNLQRKKFGFFQAEKKIFETVVQNTGMVNMSQSPYAFARHPFVWLTEAADDICYYIIDMEDAHRLGIIDSKKCEDLLLTLVCSLQPDHEIKTKNNLKAIENDNDRIAYLRAKCINALTLWSFEKFKENIEAILNGSLQISLLDLVKDNSHEEVKLALDEIKHFSIQKIYNHRSVLEIENAGYNVMSELLNHFIPPILKDKSERRSVDKKAILLVPNQFIYEEDSAYIKVLGILDFVSGMTDNFAVELYKRIKGIEIGMRL